MDERFRYADAATLRHAYETRELSPVELVRQVLALIEAAEPRLCAFVTVAAERALAQAAGAESRIRALGRKAWEERPLLGVPISVKDLIATEGIRTTRGSLRLRDWVPREDAPVVARLRRAGAVIIGKTTTSEGGWSAATVNPITRPTTNPWDHAFGAGGSSGGAAAAVAAGLGTAAIGTDGAGSIRIPAAFCGVVGLKPTFGRVPYVPFCADRLAHLGPLTRTVADAALLLDVMSGEDPRDPYSTAQERGAPLTRTRPRVGWIPALGEDPARLSRTAVAVLAEHGYQVEEIPAPFEDPYAALVTIVAAAEAAGTPADADAWADPDRLRIVEHGRRLSAVDLMRAEEARGHLRQRLSACLRRFDLLATATVPVPPFAPDAWRPEGTDPLSWLAWAPAAYPCNLAGLPAVSVPVGFTAAGLPVGLQLVAGRHRDDLVLEAARQLERARPWHSAYSRKDQP